MNSEAQRIAIAEACGNKPFTPGALGCLRWVSADHEPDDIGDGVLYLDDLPDYINDLNAMHKAEKVLDTVTQRGDYWDYLFSLTSGEFEMCHATAAQRAEAFLRTLGKWEEGK